MSSDKTFINQPPPTAIASITMRVISLLVDPEARRFHILRSPPDPGAIDLQHVAGDLSRRGLVYARQRYLAVLGEAEAALQNRG